MEEVEEEGKQDPIILPSREKEQLTNETSLPSSYENIPVLLKIKNTTNSVTMTTITPSETTMMYDDNNDDSSDDETTLEVNVEDIEEKDNDIVSKETSTTQTRPSVINLGLSFAANTATTPNNYSPTLTTDTPTHQHTNGERPERMREWLVRMINSQRFLGLEWLDTDKMIFRVPWVHAKKRDYNQERDAALFKEWAIHSGKYGDGSDVTTWKINFRCALNGLKDIVERKELEGADCRVYQMLPSTSPGKRRKRRRPIIHYSDMMQLQTTPTESPIRSVRPRLDLPLAIPTMSLTTPKDTPTTPIGSLATTPIQLVPIVSGTPTFPFHVPMVTTSTTPNHIPLSPMLPKYHPVIPQAIKPLSLMSIDVQSERNNLRQRKQESISSEHSGTSTEQNTEVTNNRFSPNLVSPTFGPSTQEKGTYVMYPPLRTGNVSWPPRKFADNPNALTIRIMYGSITVYSETLDCLKGSRIFYGPLHCRDVLPYKDEVKLFGPMDSHQISISPRHPSPLASEIFKTLKRGLVVDVEENNIYATALCRAVVYYGSSPLKHLGTLEKEERMNVFDYSKEFLPELKQNADVKSVNAPKPYVIFSFGQPWGSERSLSRNLITVVITHCRALNDLRVRNIPIYDELLYEPMEHQNIRIISPTRRDLEAEEFLNPPSHLEVPSTPN